MRVRGIPLRLLLLVSLPLVVGLGATRLASDDATAGPPAAAVAGDTLATRVDAVLAPWTAAGSPGAAVAVVREGTLIYARGFGLANLEYAVPITPSTVFHVASVSKQFTAFAVGLLAAEGRLSLDDDVRTYLPEVPDFGTPITVRQLIHHTSGLRDQWELLAMAGWRLDDVITREHILKMVANQRALNFAPGAEHLYSNTGYTLLAEIVARVSGQSFREFTDERIFRPLGMRNTHFHDDHRMIVPGRAYSYAPTAGGGFQHMPLNYANVGATSLFTTAEDLAKWDRNFYTAEVGGPELVEGMAAAGVLSDGSRISYAHALVHGEYRGVPTLGHTGADAGYRSAFVRFPEQKLTVIVLSNLGTFNPARVAQQVAEVYLDGVMAPPPGRETRPALRPVRLSERELQALPGLYASLETDQLRRIELRNGRPFLREAGVELVPVGRRRFVAPDAPRPLEIRFEPASGSDAEVGLLLHEVVDGGTPTVYAPTVALRADQLAEYAGTYFSSELGTAYTLVMKEGALVAEHRRHEDTPLMPTLRDRFVGENWWFRRLRFTRDASGRIDGFQLSGGRVRDLRFDRQES